MRPLKIGIVGTGPAALMAGSQCVLNGHEVHFFDHKKAAGRKFLVAGHGGFNLSNAEAPADFLSRYNGDEIRKFVKGFDNQQLVAWLQVIGIATYEGSTGKIFPVKGIKPIQVLQAWLNWLSHQGAVFHYEHRMLDFTNESLLLENKGIVVWQPFDRMILALGGGSWTKTGSDGTWMSLFASKEIVVNPLVSSNAGMNFNFKAPSAEMEGQVIKNVLVKHHLTERMGEITITNYGLEGGPVYYLNGSFREHPQLPIVIDLKPQWEIEKVQAVMAAAKNATEGLKKLKLSKAAIWLLKVELTKAAFTDPEVLSRQLKNLKLHVTGLRPMEEAISTSGGVSWEAVDAQLALKKYPNVSVCGEMLDWDAPTGGYLLQACFATGYFAGGNL